MEVIDVVEVLQHGHAGRPKSVLASSLGIDPKTVRKYVAPAEAAVGEDTQPEPEAPPAGPALPRNHRQYRSKEADSRNHRNTRAVSHARIFLLPLFLRARSQCALREARHEELN